MSQQTTWTLASLVGFKDGHSDATLCSERLDRTMHPSGCARVFVAGSASATPPGYVLEEFSRASIENYLDSQQYIKQTLEEQLVLEQEKWDVTPVSRGETLWQQAQVDLVTFERKRLQTAEGLANLKKAFPKINVERARKGGDQPDTRTRFKIKVDVHWDDEHSRVMTFRDGRFSSMELY